MNANVSKQIELYGVEIQVSAEFDYSETTSRESYEHFGFRGSREETETNFDGFSSGVGIDSDLETDVEFTLIRYRGWRRNRRFYKRKRQLIRAIESKVESMNPEDLWDENDCLDSLN
jgi:hypothetical protein